jgi:hypothetical protein
MINPVREAKEAGPREGKLAEGTATQYVCKRQEIL